MTGTSDNGMGGQALHFVRRLKQTPPKYRSAAEAMAAQNLESGEPPFLSVTWYESSWHGNCALALGGGLVLAETMRGTPVVVPYEHPQLGTYRGWSATIA